MSRILYLLWDPKGAGKHISEEADEWKKNAAAHSHNHKEFTVVSASDAGKLKGLQSKDQIYVLGHCQAGSDQLYSKRGEGAETLNTIKVCDSLIGCGLEVRFSGAIKFFNCESGLADKADKPAFAKRAAKYLKKKGYSSCAVIGYTNNALSYAPSSPTSTSSNVSWHKQNLIKGDLVRAGGCQINYGAPWKISTPQIEEQYDSFL
jgi:hypothetical protein